MAWVFSMWVETKNKVDRQAIIDHFKSFESLDEAQKYRILAYNDGTVTVTNISQSGIHSQKDADEMSWVGHRLYGLLKSAPDFQFALTGVEAAGWTTIEEIQKDPNDILEFKGFVIRKDIYRSIGSPGDFVEFSNSHVWTPYEGEIWEE